MNDVETAKLKEPIQVNRTEKPLHCAQYISHVRLSDGGPVRVVLDLSSALAVHGHRVTILTSDQADVPATWLDPGIDTPQLVSLGHPSRFSRLLSRSAIKQAAGVLSSCDVLHLHGAWDPVNVQLALLARRMALPYVVTVHGMLDDWSMTQRWLKKRMYLFSVGRRFLEGAAAVHCTAQAELEQASKHWGTSRGIVIPCLLDLSPFDSLPGTGPAFASFSDVDTKRKKILFLSRLHPKKGLEVLIEATALLRQRGAFVRVLIAGIGEATYVASLRTLVRDYNLGEEVRFLGLVKGIEKISLYEAADVFALPTSQENFGLVLPEAMACRTPIVTTKGVDIWREILAVGAVIADQTPSAIADALEALLNSPQRRRETGERGRRWVYDTLSPERLLGSYQEMYTRAISAAQGSRPPAV